MGVDLLLRCALIEDSIESVGLGGLFVFEGHGIGGGRQEVYGFADGPEANDHLDVDFGHLIKLIATVR